MNNVLWGRQKCRLKLDTRMKIMRFTWFYQMKRGSKSYLTMAINYLVPKQKAKPKKQHGMTVAASLTNNAWVDTIMTIWNGHDKNNAIEWSIGNVFSGPKSGYDNTKIGLDLNWTCSINK